MIKIKSISKRAIAVILATLMMLSSGIVGTLAANVDLAPTGANIPAGTKLYLTPNNYWKQNNPRYAAYFFGTGEAWVSMTAVSGETDLYEVTTPSGGTWTKVIFCRMNPSATANNWDNKWNQTSDLVYDGTKNHYTVKASTWDKGGGTWDTYTPSYIVNKAEYGLTGIEGTVKLGDTTITTADQSMTAGTYDLSIAAPNGYNISYVKVWGGTETTEGTTGTSTYSGKVNLNAPTTIRVDYVAAGYSYTVTAGEGGTVSPTSGTASSVEITATPNEGYKFAGWTTTNGSVASKTSASTTFTITSNNANATASFELEEYDLSLSQSPVSGTVKFEGEEFSSGTKKIKHNTEFNYEITAPENYVIDTLKVLGNEITEASGKASYSSSATPDAKGGSIDVTYKGAGRLVTVTLVTNDGGTDGGTVEGAGYWAHDTTVTLTATPNDENFYEFGGWEFTSSEDTYSDASDLTVNRLTFTITGDVTVKATFNKQTTYNVTKATSIYEEPDSTDIPGTVQGADIVVAGSQAILKAIAEPGFKFREWTIDGTIAKDQDLTSPFISIIPTSNVTVTAVFDRIPTYSITVNQSGYDTTKNDTRNHSIKLDGVTKFENAPEGNKNIVDVLEGEHTIYICGPVNHYIAGFKVNGDDVMAQAKKDQSEWVVSYTFNVTADTDIEVVYHYNPTITIKTNVDGVASSNLYTDVVCNYNGTKTITLSEKPGYYISGIEGLGSYDFTNGTDTNLRSKSITLSKVTEDVVATVYYKDLPTFTVTVNADTTKGSVSPAVGTRDYEPGTTVNFTAAPISGYYTEWYVNGTKQTKGNTFTYTVNSNVTVEAKFCPQQWDCVLFVEDAQNTKWGQVNAHVWKVTGGDYFGAWPGAKMEKVDTVNGNPVYAVYIDIDASQIGNYRLKLSNNGASKTRDLVFNSKYNYYRLGGTNSGWSYSDREYTPTKYVYGVNGSVITDVDQGNYGNAKYKGQVEFRAQTSLSNIDDTDEYYVKAQWDGVNTVDIYTTVVHSDFKVDGWVINGTKFVSADKTTVANEFRGTIPVAYLYEIENDAVAVYSHSEAWRNAHPEIGTVTLFADISQVSDITAYNWGEYISAYTWNQKDTSNGDKWGDGGYEQFGEWEGQLMIPVGDERSGVFYTVVEKKGVLPNYTNDVMGITFTNFGGHSPCNNSVGFLQTYDYYEFIKLQDKDNIMFVLQPTDNTSNKDTISSNFIGYTKKTSANNLDAFGTFDYLTDYDGIVMDIYRDHLTDAEIEANDVGLYVVRTGPYDSGSTDKNSVNIDGQYYIDCFVYDKDRKFIGRCKSFELLDLESLVAKNPDFAVLTDESTKANFEGKLVKVAYEYPDYIKDNATRVDGEWYGVDNTKTITLTTRVAELTKEGVIVADSNKAEYGSASIDGKEIWEGPVSTEQLLGSVNRSSDYKFVGWYHGKLDDNGNVTVDEDEPKISSNTDAKFTPYQSGYFVAVFEELASGTFTVNNYSYIVDLDAPGQPPVYNKLGLDASYRYVKIDKIDENGNVIEPGVKSDQKPADEAYYSTINVTEDDILKITIYTIPKYTETDKVYAWYMKTTEADGTYNYEEVGTEEIKKFGVGEEATFTFTYVITEDYQKSLTIYSDVLTKTAEITLDYRYINRYHHEKSYTKSYTLIGEELANNRPSDDAIRANAPYVNDLYKDVRWVISEIKADETGARFILEAQYDELIEVNVSVMGQTVDTITGKFNEAHSLYATDYDDDANPVTNKGFWYVELGDEGDGEFTEGVDAILSYGTYYGLVFTEDMDINYVTTESLDFKVILNAPIYGREQATGVDMVYTDFIINYLVPYFSGEPVVEGGKPVFDVENKNAPIQLDIYAEAAGVTVEYGMVHQLINTYNPDAALNDQNLKDYFNTNPLSENEIKAFENFLNKCKETGKTSGMDSTGQLFNYKYTGKNDLTNKNRALMTFITNNSEANRNKYFTAIAYLAITDANGDTKYYFSNVELFNIKDFVENNKGSDIVE